MQRFPDNLIYFHISNQGLILLVHVVRHDLKLVSTLHLWLFKVILRIARAVAGLYDKPVSQNRLPVCNLMMIDLPLLGELMVILPLHISWIQFLISTISSLTEISRL